MIFAISPFLVCHYGAMDVGNDDMGVGNDCICVDCQFGLKEGSY